MRMVIYNILKSIFYGATPEKEVDFLKPKRIPEFVYIDENEISWDLCVVCGQKSPYTSDTDIRERLAYIEGVGQCCNIHYSSVVCSLR